MFDDNLLQLSEIWLAELKMYSNTNILVVNVHVLLAHKSITLNKVEISEG